ncbi:MAG: hypothetical protein SO314_08710, partial [Alphaproteobacteria bacterium]|nr:hypothetical protein [Alphaproteobacteria bacterium]
MAILLSYFCLIKRPNVGSAQKNQAQPHFLSFQPKVKVAMLQGLVLNIHLFGPKAKKSFGNRAGQLRHLGSLRLLTLSSLAKMFQRACRQKQPEQRLFLLSASPAPLSKEGEICGTFGFCSKTQAIRKGYPIVLNRRNVLW